jgi:glutamate/tyrosine decarboxylase-like PLP-dependent enzyme
LAVGWDQCAFNSVVSPAAGAAELVAGSWLKDLLHLPSSASTGFVTGAQAANTAGLAAARHRVLGEVGWDVEQRGLRGAPTVHVIASEERHATIDRSLRLLGLGNDSAPDNGLQVGGPAQGNVLRADGRKRRSDLPADEAAAMH